MFDSDELQKVDEGIEILTISHPLTIEEKEEMVYQLLSTFNLKQVYFTDSVDLTTIELVKCMIEFSSNIDDENIEKIVLISNPRLLEEISLLNFKYPDTWYLSFNNNIDSNELISVPRYRNMNNYFNSVIEYDNCSKYELVTKIYNVIKAYKYEDSNLNSFYLPDVIERHVSNSYGLNTLFSLLLNRANIANYVGYYKVDGIKKYITLIDIIDDKYNLNGLYLFDPVSDNSFGNIVTSDYYYNYFGLSVSDFNYFKKKTELIGLLGILAIQDYSICLDKLNNNLNIVNNSKENSLASLFNCDYKKIHDRFHSTISIDSNILFSAIKNIHANFDITHLNSLETKYNERKMEIFNDKNILIDEECN